VTFVIGTLLLFLGCVVGSFLNVCIDRLPARRSLISPASRCDACGTRLVALDLIPVISYLLLKGRCRYCGAPIPLRVLLVELATGIAFAFLWLHYGLNVELAAGLLFTSLFIAIFVIDIRHHLILNVMVYPAIVAAVAFALLTHRNEVLYIIYGGLAGAGLLLVIALVFPGSMGLGDVKFGALMGLVVGFPQVFVGLTVSFILGGILGAMLLATRRRGRRDPVAFGPFLTVGAMVAMLYGQDLVRWYLNLGG
jgi:leader peptidase (prepilin peptidase)/N-methyltransferase